MEKIRKTYLDTHFTRGFRHGITSIKLLVLEVAVSEIHFQKAYKNFNITPIQAARFAISWLRNEFDQPIFSLTEADIQGDFIYPPMGV